MSAVENVGPEALPGLQEQVEQIIAEARRQGASACEVSVSLEQGLSTSVRQREVETVEFNRDQGFGITLYVGQRKGSASTSATGPAAIRETVAAALAIAEHASEDEFAGLADAQLTFTTLGRLRPSSPSKWRWSARQRLSPATAGSAMRMALRSAPIVVVGCMATAMALLAVMPAHGTALVA